MRLYEYRCVACRAIVRVFNSVEERNAPETCPDCGAIAYRIFSVPQDYKHVWKQPTDPEKLRTTPEIWT